jgi:hypothetical protein
VSEQFQRVYRRSREQQRRFHQLDR